MLKTIQNLPIDHVLVNLKRSDVPIPEPVAADDVPDESADQPMQSPPPDGVEITDPERLKADAMRRKRAETEGNYRKASEQIEQMTNDLKDRPANVVHDIDQVIVQMSSLFDDDVDVIVQMVNLGDGEHREHHHIANVAMLSLMLGKAVGMNAAELTLLGTAALLHDVGKIKIPLAIKNKKSELTHAEAMIYQQHTLAGSQFIQQVKAMNVEVLNVIEQHHEFIDGSGYPKGLKGDQLSRYVRIVSVANMYDNLCNPSNAEAAMTPKIALATLYKQYRNKLDAHLVERLIGLLGVYPPGTVVKLSNDSIALVISGDSTACLNPNVLLYNPDVAKSDAKMVNLADYPDLNIVQALKPGEYSPEIHQYLGLSERVGYMLDCAQQE